MGAPSPPPPNPDAVQVRRPAKSNITLQPELIPITVDEEYVLLCASEFDCYPHQICSDEGVCKREKIKRIPMIDPLADTDSDNFNGLAPLTVVGLALLLVVGITISASVLITLRRKLRKTKTEVASTLQEINITGPLIANEFPPANQAEKPQC
jgi:hypothetical protein